MQQTNMPEPTTTTTTTTPTAPATPAPAPTEPVTSQPGQSIFPEAAPLKVNKWSQGLCGCLGDISLAGTSLCVPCVVFGKNAETLNKNCLVWGFLSIFPCVFGTLQRGEIRERKGIEGTRVNDCLTWSFCPYCALVQEASEVQQSTNFSNAGQVINRA